ncbi:MAG: ECF-type sigma factor [Pirellulaceae bacterium]
MHVAQHSVTQWLQDLQSGDEEAARRLWERYFEQLVQVARKRLGGAPRRIADEEDVALSAFDSLCRRAARGGFDEVADREGLWRLLIVMARQKAVDRIRSAMAQKRGGGEVRGESVFGPASADMGIDQIACQQPTPEFLADVDERYQACLQSLRDDTLRNIAVRRLEGYSTEEIAREVGITARSVRRKLDLIRATWRKVVSHERHQER